MDAMEAVFAVAFFCGMGLGILFFLLWEVFGMGGGADEKRPFRLPAPPFVIAGFAASFGAAGLLSGKLGFPPAAQLAAGLAVGLVLAGAVFLLLRRLARLADVPDGGSEPQG